MEAMSGNPEAIARLIREANTVAVCSHINPDGDTLSCAAAMRLALLKLGKKVDIFCDGKVPNQLSFLPGIGEMRLPAAAEDHWDLLLSVDVSDPKRMGGCLSLKEKAARTAQVDHHPTNPLFMEENWVDGEAPACALLIRELLKLLGVELDRELAICFYTGVSTDTGNFAFAATNAACFTMMSELMDCDLPLAELNGILFRDREMPQVKLIGRAISGMRYYENGRIAVMKLTEQDFADCGALPEHADTVVNFGLYTVGTRFAMLAREGTAVEGKQGTVKFSLRAKNPDIISDVAQRFGGGGHPQAAGITMDGTLDEAAGKVLEAMIQKLNG